jgi:hypothetical protein
MGVTHTDVNIKNMSHCISVFLIKKEELRDSKLETLLENKNQNGIKFTELNCGILATTHIPNLKEFGKDKTIAKIETDYFGGAGWQSAKLFVNNKKVYDGYDSPHTQPINDLLCMMGVVRNTGYDEFDTIGLGKYRSNQDFK